MSISHGLDFEYYVEKSFTLVVLFVQQSDFYAPVPGESFAVFVANDCVLCHQCGVAFVGLIVSVVSLSSVLMCSIVLLSRTLYWSNLRCASGALVAKNFWVSF